MRQVVGIFTDVRMKGPPGGGGMLITETGTFIGTCPRSPSIVGGATASAALRPEEAAGLVEYEVRFVPWEEMSREWVSGEG